MPEKNKKDTADEKKPVYEIKFDDSTAVFEKDILKDNPPNMRGCIRHRRSGTIGKF